MAPIGPTKGVGTCVAKCALHRCAPNIVPENVVALDGVLGNANQLPMPFPNDSSLPNPIRFAHLFRGNSWAWAPVWVTSRLVAHMFVRRARPTSVSRSLKETMRCFGCWICGATPWTNGITNKYYIMAVGLELARVQDLHSA